MTSVALAIAALRRGELAVIPTDTVYGLAADGLSEAAASALYAAKSREPGRPTALVVSSVGQLLDLLPALPAAAIGVARALLPGPVTLVLPNPACTFAWLNPGRPDAIGVRVPLLAGPGREILDALTVLVATSANLPGGRDPRRVADVPEGIVRAAAAVVDGGELPGTPSTVVDLTGDVPLVLREGALSAADVLARVRAARDS